MTDTPHDAPLLAEAIRLAACDGEATADEIRAALSRALSDPGAEACLRALLEAEGVPAEHRREYLKIFAEWRSASLAQRRSSS
jgi:hypothetical protein